MRWTQVCAPRSVARIALALSLIGGAVIARNAALPSPETFYTFSILAGRTTGLSVDGPQAVASFNRPMGVVVGPSGATYVTSNHAIRKVQLDGSISTLAGVAGNPGSADGIGSAARFNSPEGIAVDASETLYVADSENYTIRKIAPDGTVSTLAGSPGHSGRADGPGSVARFGFPTGVAVDALGVVYVADHGACTVRQIATDNTVSTLAGLAGACDQHVAGTGSAARFYGGPSAIALGPAGVVYVTEWLGYVSRIYPGGLVNTLASPGPPLRGIAVSHDGTVYVTQSGECLSYGPPGHNPTFYFPALMRIAGDTGAITTSRPFVSATCVIGPLGLNLDAAGNVLVADTDSNRILQVAPDQTLTSIGADPSPLRTILSIALEDTGAVDVFDRFGSPSSIHRVAPDGTVTTRAAFTNETISLAAAGETLYLNRVFSTPPGVPPPSPALYTMSPAGLLSFVANAGAGDIAVDGTGTVYVADETSHVIRRVSSGGIVTTLAGLEGVTGSADGVGAAARFNTPKGVAVDAGGTVYVADFGNYTIRQIAPDGHVTTLAGLAGARGAVDGSGAAARFFYPEKLTVDAGGHLFVRERYGCTIREVSGNGDVRTVGGLDRQCEGTNGPGVDARFDQYPGGIAAAADGTLFVATTGGGGTGALRKGVRAASTPLTIAAGPADQTVLAGGTARFSLATSGAPAPRCQWQVSTDSGVSWSDLFDLPVSGASTCVLTPHDVSVSMTGSQYRAVATNLATSVTSGPATLTVTAPPAITTDPASLVVPAGQTARFAVTASGSPAPRYQWQLSPNGVSWANVPEALPYSGTASPTLTVRGVNGSVAGLRYRCVATNVAGSATSGVATLAVSSPGVWPASLQFGATKAGSAGALLSVTPPQAATVSFVGATGPWTATADQPWVQITNGSGTGTGRFTVAIANPGNVIGASQTLTSTISVAAGSLGSTTVAVTLTVDETGTSTAAPFGQVDTPVQGATGVAGAIGVTGWVIDDVGVSSVKIYRACLSLEPQANCQLIQGTRVVYVGDATFVPGTRPDVEAAFPTYPASSVAGWGYLLLTNMLPRTTGAFAGSGGEGPVTLYAVATDLEGHQTWLGRAWTGDQTPTSITMDNDTIAKPFGAIDTPAQGATVSGTSPNFGWVLTPDSNTTADGTDILMPADGTTMHVFIDGVAVGTVAYNQCRGIVGNPVPVGLYCDDDVANIFGNPTPQPTFTTRTSNATLFRNLDVGRAAIGSFDINTTTLPNGMHSLAWGVTDSAGRTEGIGSRNFWVLNAGADGPVARDTVSRESEVRALMLAPVQSRGEAAALPSGVATGARVTGRVGFDPTAPLEDVAADGQGVRQVRVPDSGRVELQLGGSADAGYLVIGDTLRDLPIGSHLDLATGAFTWAPAPGYLGTYHLAFVRDNEQIPIDVTIRPMAPAAAGESEIRMNVDLPSDGGVVHGPVTIAGWALDPQAWTGSGIGAIHVWAYRRDAPSIGPQFLGAADLHAVRPDVASAFGAEFDRAGFSVITTALLPGEYDLVVYAWCARTGRWEDARTVRAIVR